MSAGYIFDYGGTLDTGGDHWYHVIADAYRRNGVDVADADLRRAYVEAERRLGRYDVPRDATFGQLLELKIGWQLEALGIDDDTRRLLIARDCDLTARHHTALAAKRLRRLHAHARMAVVSNFYGNLRAVLADYGLLDCFDVVVDSAEAGVRKPDPAIFRIALDALGLAPEEVTVVGDSMANDILPARSLGCRTYHVEGRAW